MNKLKRHLSVANVLSCVALFVALSATAVAATKIGAEQVKSTNIAKLAVTNPKLGKEAVTAGKIKKGSVTAAKLGSGAVINSKLASKAVTNAKLGNEAVGANKLAKNAVTAAKIGPEVVTTGKVGNEAISAGKLSSALYRQLLKNVTYVTETSGPQSDTERAVSALCPVGKEAIGGGVRVTGANTKVVPTESAPLVSATNARVGWSVSGREIAPEAESWTILAYATCAEL